MFRSSLYVGRVRHRRYGDPVHEFDYPVWHALIDLDELAELASRVRGFSHNRFNLLGFDDRDHMGPSSDPVRAKVETWLRAQGVEGRLGKITLLTHLRLLGHVFNPVSFFFCCDPGGVLRHVIAEVNNTFGESFCYLLETDGNRVQHERDKRFHVSPFQPVDGRYHFRLSPPGPRFAAHIDVVRDGEIVFDSTLTGFRKPLTGLNVFKTVLRYPHSGLRTLALIHFQALRLWLKRAPYFKKPAPPEGAWRTRNG